MDASAAPGAARGAHPEPGAAKQRRARAWLMALIPATAALYALAAYASVSFLDTFRLMAVNDLEGWGDGADGLSGGIMSFVGAVIAASLLGFAVSRRSTTVFGTLKAGAVMSQAVGFGGAALGLLHAWLSDRWTRPREVGRFAAEEGGGSDWGPLAWIAYCATWLLPLVFGGVAVIALLWLAGSHGRGRWADTKAEEIKEHGVMMPGTIHRVEFTGVWVMGEPQFEVTVTYVGKYGPRQAVERFVTSTVSAPVRGGQVDVWYDPLGEEGVVLIELNERSTSSMLYPD